MSAPLSRLRKVAAIAMVLFALGGGLAACADIHPDNTFHSPVFRNYP